MFGFTRRTVCWALGCTAVMAAFAQPARATTVLVPSDLECGVESYYSENTCGTLEAGIWASESVRRFATLLHFELDGYLPSGAEVTSATLHMNRIEDVRSDYDPDDELSVYAMVTPFTSSDSWSSLGGGEWDNPGMADTPEDTIDPADGPLEWDVTALVSAWATSSLDNYGLGIADDESKSTGSQRSQFWDTWAIDPTKWPHLEIEYTL